jgi:hypothetical protein
MMGSTVQLQALATVLKKEICQQHLLPPVQTRGPYMQTSLELACTFIYCLYIHLSLAVLARCGGTLAVVINVRLSLIEVSFINP